VNVGADANQRMTRNSAPAKTMNPFFDTSTSSPDALKLDAPCSHDPSPAPK
jgi:hypothetical protein